MSILKIKVKLNAAYDSEKQTWSLNQGDINHLNPGDELKIASSENWAGAPASAAVLSISEGEFTLSATPSGSSEITAVLIKSYDLADPMSLQWDLSDLDSSEGTGTNQLGVTFRDRIATKRQVQCAWGELSQGEMAQLLKAMTDLFFELEFPDALKGEVDSMEVYVSNKTAPLYRCISTDAWRWTSMSVTFTER